MSLYLTEKYSLDASILSYFIENTRTDKMLLSKFEVIFLK